MKDEFENKDIVLKSYVIEGILPKINLLIRGCSKAYLYLFLHPGVNRSEVEKGANLKYRTSLTALNYLKKLKLIDSNNDLINNNLNNTQAINFINEIDKKIIDIKPGTKLQIEKANNIKIDMNYSVRYQVIEYLMNKFDDDYSSLLGIVDKKKYKNNLIAAQALCVSYSTYNRYCVNGNFEEGKLLDIEMNDFFTRCPICGKEFDEYKILYEHVIKSRELNHKKLKNLIGSFENVPNYLTFMKIYNDNEKDIKSSSGKLNNKIKSEIDEKANSAVKYFFAKSNGKSSCWARDCNMIKSHLKSDMDYNDVIIVMDYLIKDGRQDLRLFNSSINKALTCKKFKEDMDIIGTEAFLVSKFHRHFGLRMNDRTITQSMDKINALKNNDYTYDQIEVAVDYMIQNDIRIFNFIVNKIDEALLDIKPKSKRCLDCTSKQLAKYMFKNDKIDYGVLILDGNMIKIDIIYKIKNDIIKGEIDLVRVNKLYNNFAYYLAVLILKNKKYLDIMDENTWKIKTKIIERRDQNLNQ